MPAVAYERAFVGAYNFVSHDHGVRKDRLVANNGFFSLSGKPTAADLRTLCCAKAGTNPSYHLRMTSSSLVDNYYIEC